MESKFIALICACLPLVAEALFSSTPARAAEERVWTLSGPGKKKTDPVSLEYGAPESDYVTVVFSCKPKGGEVGVFVSETSAKLKPGKRAAATLAVGEARATVPGRLTVNEEAGSPSFDGSLPANDPIFAAMAGGGTLLMTVGPSKETAPLTGAAEKVKKFAQACAKP